MNTKARSYAKPENPNAVLPFSRSAVLAHRRDTRFQDKPIAAKPHYRLAVMPFMRKDVFAAMQIDVITACRVAVDREAVLPVMRHYGIPGIDAHDPKAEHRFPEVRPPVLPASVPTFPANLTEKWEHAPHANRTHQRAAAPAHR